MHKDSQRPPLVAWQSEWKCLIPNVYFTNDPWQNSHKQAEVLIEEFLSYYATKGIRATCKLDTD